MNKASNSKGPTHLLLLGKLYSWTVSSLTISFKRDLEVPLSRFKHWTLDIWLISSSALILWKKWITLKMLENISIYISCTFCLVLSLDHKNCSFFAPCACFSCVLFSAKVPVRLLFRLEVGRTGSYYSSSFLYFTARVFLEPWEDMVEHIIFILTEISHFIFKIGVQTGRIVSILYD